MGKGDKKSKKGKIFKGSFGVVRTRKKKNEIVTQKKSEPKKTISKKRKTTKK